METITIIGALPYDKVRQDCHKVKDGDEYVINHYAWQIVKQNGTCLLEGNPIVFLVPIPGHTGDATHALTLAKAIGRELNEKGGRVGVLDCLECEPHEPLYDKKKRGEDIYGIDLKMHFKSKKLKNTFDTIKNAQYTNTKLFLIDNVVDTGHTIREAFKATGNLPVIAIGDTGLCNLNQ